MKWFKRTIVGSKHFEYRNEEHEKYQYLFDIEKTQSGKIRLYDLRNQARMYLFTTVKEAQKIAIRSITEGAQILEPYVDKAFYELSERTTKVIEETQAFIDKYKDVI